MALHLLSFISFHKRKKQQQTNPCVEHDVDSQATFMFIYKPSNNVCSCNNRLHHINHPGLTTVALLISRASTAIALTKLWEMPANLRSLSYHTDRQRIIIIQLPALGIHQQPTHKLNQHLCLQLHDSKKVGKNNNTTRTEGERMVGRGCYKIFEKIKSLISRGLMLRC